MKKIKFFSIFLSTIIFLQIFSTTVFGKSFTDTEEHWAKNYINHISSMEVLNGYEDGSFRPSNNITRAEVLKIISLYHSKSLNKLEFDSYSKPKDIDETYSWISDDDLKNVLGNKYMNGYPDGSFNPSGNITRAEFAQTIYNMKNYESNLPEITKSVLLTDINNHWANVPIRDLSNREIINGYEDGSFKPNNYISRAEAVTILAKFGGFNMSNNENDNKEFSYYEVFQNGNLINKHDNINDAIKEALKYENSSISKNGETCWDYNSHIENYVVYQDNVYIGMYYNISDAVAEATKWSNSTIENNGEIVWEINGYKRSYNLYQNDSYIGSFSSLDTAATKGLTLSNSRVEKNGKSVWSIDIAETGYKVYQENMFLGVFSTLSEAIEEAQKWAGSIVEKNSETVWKFTKNKLIVIDPGHGGPASGAVSASKKYFEKDLNLSVSLKLRSELEKRGYTVLMTRETDVLPFGSISDNSSLASRINFANNNNADMFISVHFNSFGTTIPSGIETFYELEKPQDKPLATALQNALMNDIISENRGVKATSPIINKKLHVLYHSKVPAALVELGFISNPVDELTLVTDSYHNKAANALANGVDNYFK